MSSSSNSESYVIEIRGSTVGIVVREDQARRFAFHAASHRFNRYDGMTFPGPRDAERYLSSQIAGRLHILSGELVA